MLVHKKIITSPPTRLLAGNCNVHIVVRIVVHNVFYHVSADSTQIRPRMLPITRRKAIGQACSLGGGFNDLEVGNRGKIDGDGNWLVKQLLCQGSILRQLPAIAAEFLGDENIL